MFSGNLFLFFFKSLEIMRKLPWQHCFPFLFCSLFSCVPVSPAYVSDGTQRTQQTQLSKGKKISIQPDKGLSSLSHHQGGIVPSMINTSELQKLVEKFTRLKKLIIQKKNIF